MISLARAGLPGLPGMAFTQAPLWHGICKRLPQGPPEKDLYRIPTRKHPYGITQDPLERNFTRSPQEPVYTKFTMKMHPAKTLRTRGAIFLCTSLRSQNAHGHPTKTRTYKKNAAPQDPDAHFVWVCAVEMHMDMLCENLWKKCRGPDGAPWSNHI